MKLDKKIFSLINSHDIESKSIKLIKDSLNSEIYSIIFKGKESILKIYKSVDNSRIKRETMALEILKTRNFKNVPEIYISNFDNKYIIMSLIRGQVPNYDKNFIERLATYINDMQCYIKLQDKENLPYASEAASSINEHFQKTILKLNSIKQKLKSFDSTNEIIKIIELRILPWIFEYRNFLLNNYSDFKKKLTINEMIFSQSDIGAHNAFIDKNIIYTYDYEYAGIDDPSKTFCDLIIQPNLIFNNENFIMILNVLKKIKIFKDCYYKALIILPLYRYKWFAIILNSYLKNKKLQNSNSELFLRKAKNYLKKTYKPVKSIINNKEIKDELI